MDFQQTTRAIVGLGLEACRPYQVDQRRAIDRRKHGRESDVDVVRPDRLGAAPFDFEQIERVDPAAHEDYVVKVGLKCLDQVREDGATGYHLRPTAARSDSTAPGESPSAGRNR